MSYCCGWLPFFHNPNYAVIKYRQGGNLMSPLLRVFMNRSLLIAILTATAIASIVLGLSLGSAGTDPLLAWQSIQGDGNPALREIILELRLPRVLAAFGVGASLALAGVLMQVLLRNPLADPYILGTSGGAAVAALLALMFGASGILVDGFAFAGALCSTLLVFSLTSTSADHAPGRLLLTGVVVAAGWGAAISLILALAPEQNLRGMLFWLMGDFSFALQPLPSLTVSVASVVAGLLIAPMLNLLATGDKQAALLGVSVGPARTCLYFLSSLLTAIAVTTAGTVGFVGLVVPHLVRLAGDADHRTVVPCSALAGGSLLVIADTVARTMFAPRQLPVGAITALLGIPLFLLLLKRLGSAER
jgi:iron complex transport system permease protein